MGDPSRETSRTPEALLGTGLDEFIALDDGMELFIEQGYQGGFHLTVNARITGFDARSVSIAFDGSLANTGEPACQGEYENVRLKREDDGWMHFGAGARCYVQEPMSVTMQDVLLALEVRDGEGGAARDVQRIRAGRIIRPY